MIDSIDLWFFFTALLGSTMVVEPGQYVRAWKLSKTQWAKFNNEVKRWDH